MQCPLFRLNLLKAKTIPVLIEIVESRPIPLLVLLRILLLKPTDVLRQLLK